MQGFRGVYVEATGRLSRQCLKSGSDRHQARFAPALWRCDWDRIELPTDLGAGPEATQQLQIGQTAVEIGGIKRGLRGASALLCLQ